MPDPKSKPSATPPGVFVTRETLLLLKDLPRENAATVSRGWIVSAPAALAGELQKAGTARRATETDIAAWGREPQEI